MTTTLGIPKAWGEQPERVPVRITTGADFILVIEPPNGETFPAGTAIRIAFFADEDTMTELASWPAAVSPTRAEIVKQSETTTTIVADTYTRVYISYPDTPTADYCLTVGPVIRY